MMALVSTTYTSLSFLRIQIYPFGFSYFVTPPISKLYLQFHLSSF